MSGGIAPRLEQLAITDLKLVPENEMGGLPQLQLQLSGELTATTIREYLTIFSAEFLWR